MANIFYNTAKKEIFDGTVDLLANTIKLMLVTASYTPNADDDVAAAGGANDPDDHEANVTNYTRGHAGAGRKTLASKAIVVDKTNDRAEFDAADVTWTALGNGTNQALVAGIIIKEAGADDTSTRLIAYVDFSDFTTNGADFTLQWDAEGIIHLTGFLGWLELIPSLIKKTWSWISSLLTPQGVVVARSLGLRPHIYRSVSPIRFSIK